MKPFVGLEDGPCAARRQEPYRSCPSVPALYLWWLGHGLPVKRIVLFRDMPYLTLISTLVDQIATRTKDLERAL